MTHLPHSIARPFNIDGLRKDLLDHPDVPLIAILLGNCHSEPEVLAVWAKLIKKLERRELLLISSLALSYEIKLVVPPSLLNKLKKLIRFR